MGSPAWPRSFQVDIPESLQGFFQPPDLESGSFLGGAGNNLAMTLPRSIEMDAFEAAMDDIDSVPTTSIPEEATLGNGIKELNNLVKWRPMSLRQRKVLYRFVVLVAIVTILWGLALLITDLFLNLDNFPRFIHSVLIDRVINPLNVAAGIVIFVYFINAQGAVTMHENALSGQANRVRMGVAKVLSRASNQPGRGLKGEAVQTGLVLMDEDQIEFREKGRTFLRGRRQGNHLELELPSHLILDD